MLYLIEYLKNEDCGLKKIETPKTQEGRKRLLRSLMNIRPPKAVSEKFLKIQDEYLQKEQAEKRVVSISELPLAQTGLYLWQGDITALVADSIVNAANDAMLGCFVPCHGCIDNAIHSAAGVQLRLECSRIMGRQNTPEPTGRAKITNAYNLPCRYVLHTVGPIIRDVVTTKERDQLAACYRSCLELAESYSLRNVAFCCISTGEFRFPNEEAAEIAIQTVKKYRKEKRNAPEVIFNVFKDDDYDVYDRLLRTN